MSTSTPRPLEGIRVLDLTVALSGPYAALLLAGMGAEVIHVEAPGKGDIARTNPPFVGDDGIHYKAKGAEDISLTVLNRGRNKKSVTLDLKSPKGKALFFELVKHSDILLENMSEGTAERIGVGYEAVSGVNPKIIYGSISAFGDPSSFPGLKGMDITVQAASGIMEVTGYPDGPPTRCGIPMADMLAPMFAVQGILAAFIHRAHTGEGQHIKVSMLDSVASWVAEEHFDVSSRAGYPMRTGNFLDRLAPFGVYQTKDGHVAIAAFNPDWMVSLFEALGQRHLAQDPRFSSRGPRMQNADELNAMIQDWTRQRTSEEVVAELLGKRGVPATRVRSPLEVLEDPHLHESGAVMQLEHPRLGKIGAVGMGLPIQFSKTKSQFDRPARELGADNNEILGELLKLSPSEIEELRTANVI